MLGQQARASSSAAGRLRGACVMALGSFRLPFVPARSASWSGYQVRSDGAPLSARA